jgi:hypothetical protein
MKTSDDPLILSRSRRRRTALCACLGGLVFGLAGRLAGGASEPDFAGAPDFSAFKSIVERNIFNTTRSVRGSPRVEGERALRVDTITLYGTLQYEKGLFAFFTGSSPEYKQVLSTGQSIAGYTITEVDGGGVKLSDGNHTVELRVGMQLRREEEGNWQVADSVETRSGRARGNVIAAADRRSADDESDVVKRMMKQREEELK